MSRISINFQTLWINNEKNNFTTTFYYPNEHTDRIEKP